MKFCVKCGRKGETKEGLCERCYLEVHPSIKMPENIAIKVCESCGRVFHNGIWARYHSLEGAVDSTVKENIKTKEKIKVNPLLEYDKPKAEVIVGRTNEKYTVPLKIIYDQCKKCGKDVGKYFEGTLQVRDVKPEVEKYIMDELKRGPEEGVFVKDFKEFKNGVDINITSQKYLLALGKKLKRRFKGNTKVTRRLFTQNRQTSKYVYRVTLLYRQQN